MHLSVRCSGSGVLITPPRGGSVPHGARWSYRLGRPPKRGGLEVGRRGVYGLGEAFLPPRDEFGDVLRPPGKRRGGVPLESCLNLHWSPNRHEPVC